VRTISARLARSSAAIGSTQGANVRVVIEWPPTPA
jgi:hypothetical protein